MTADRETPAHLVARLVALYRGRYPLTDWSTAQPSADVVRRILTQNPARMQVAMTLGHAAHGYNRAPVESAAAVAYLLLDEGHGIATVRRFLAPALADPPEHERALDPRDPRVSLARTMRIYSAQHEPHAYWETMAYMIRAWNFWVRGERLNTVRWQKDWGMPSLERARLPHGCAT